MSSETFGMLLVPAVIVLTVAVLITRAFLRRRRVISLCDRLGLRGGPWYRIFRGVGEVVRSMGRIERVLDEQNAPQKDVVIKGEIKKRECPSYAGARKAMDDLVKRHKEIWVSMDKAMEGIGNSKKARARARKRVSQLMTELGGYIDELELQADNWSLERYGELLKTKEYSRFEEIRNRRKQRVFQHIRKKLRI